MPGLFCLLLHPSHLPPPQSGRSHQVSDSGAWEAALSVCWPRDTSLGPAHPERPKMPRRWTRILQMYEVYICSMDEEIPKFLRTPVIRKGLGILELLGLDTKSVTQIWRWTQML